MPPITNNRNKLVGAICFTIIVCVYLLRDTSTTVTILPDHIPEHRDASCAVSQAMFPTWPLFFAHYRWQVELKFHACRVGDTLVDAKKNCNGMEATTPEKVLRNFYVDELERRIRVDAAKRSRDDILNSKFGPFDTIADAMTGYPKLANVRHVLQLANRSGLSGNFVETGVWRGGTSLYARLLQKNFFNPESHVYLCDSFAGLPSARTNVHKSDTDWTAYRSVLGVPLGRVQQLFIDYDAFDATHVHFKKGYFVDSMPGVREELLANNRKISVLRLDGDMYESTIDVLYFLYDLVEVGGYIIIDDWFWKESAPVAYFGAQTAVFDFRHIHGIEDEAHAIIEIRGDDGAFFRKARDVTVKRELYPKNVKPTKKFTKQEGFDYVQYWDSVRNKVWHESDLW